MSVPVAFALLIAGGALVVAVLVVVFRGSESLARRLARGRLRDRSDEGDAGFGPLAGEQGLIERPELRERDR